MIFRAWFKCMIWNSNRKRDQFILYYKRGVNPRGWIYTPIHFRNVQHRKRYFYLRSGIFIQLWTTTRLRTIVLPFYFRKYVCRGVVIAAMSWLFMLCWKMFAIQAVNSKKKKFIFAVGSLSNYGLQLGYVPLFCLFTFRKYVCRGVVIAAMSWLFMPCSKLFAIQAVNSKNFEHRKRYFLSPLWDLHPTMDYN